MRHIDRPVLRISSIVVGLLGLGLVYLTGWGWQVVVLFLPWVIILLGYGIFGLFGTVKSRPAGKPQEKVPHQELLGIPYNAAPLPRKGWSKTKKTGIGCGITIILLICAVAGYFAYTSRPAKTLSIKVNYPKTVQVGDSFELTLYLTNTGEKDFEVQTIELSPADKENYHSILAGASVTSTEPDMNSFEYSFLKNRVYCYFQILKPGETQKVILNFQAVNAGTFDTDVDVSLSDSWAYEWDIMIYITP